MVSLPAQRRRRGVTLVEVLVAVGVLSLLIALLFPALGSARRAAGEAASLANGAQLAQIVEQYAAGNQSRYPVVTPEQNYWVSAGDPPLGLAGAPRWETEWMWAAVIRQTIPWDAWLQSCLSPGRDVDEARSADTFVPSYRFSTSFVASPLLWTGQGQRDAAARPGPFLQPVGTAMVAHPSAKAMLVDFEVAYDRRPKKRIPGGMPGVSTAVVFADGHADPRNPADAGPIVTNALNASDFARAALHNTESGVSGADYR